MKSAIMVGLLCMATAIALPCEGQELKSYSRYDFLSGEKVIFFDNFAQDNLGDAPYKWVSNSGPEVVALTGYPGKWLKTVKGGSFMATLPEELPENFSVEFDLIYASLELGPVTFEVYSKSPDTGLDDIWPGSGIKVTINPGPEDIATFFCYIYEESEKEAKGDREGKYLKLAEGATQGEKVHVSLMVQKNRMRLWVDDSKIFDVPNCLSFYKIKANSFRLYLWDSQAEPFVTNVRIATGYPDLRGKLMADGKIVSRGITFDSGSDKIRPESYGVLKSIADVLKGMPEVRVSIVGHTDNEGNPTANLELSKKRAMAIKVALTSIFAIDGGRLETAGQGQMQPVDSNETPEGRANNRRVEFVKL